MKIKNALPAFMLLAFLSLPCIAAESPIFASANVPVEVVDGYIMGGFDGSGSHTVNSTDTIVGGGGSTVELWFWTSMTSHPMCYDRTVTLKKNGVTIFSHTFNVGDSPGTFPTNFMASLGDVVHAHVEVHYGEWACKTDQQIQWQLEYY